MHELSIATALTETVCKQLEAAGWNPSRQRVSVVRARVGVLSGVVSEALGTAFDAAAIGTALAGAKLEIEQANLVVWCPRCDRERAIGERPPLKCPVCGSPTPRIVQGTELEIASIELIDATANTPGSTTHPQKK